MAQNAAAVAREAYKFLKDPVVHQMVKTFAIPLASTLIAWYNGPSQQNPTVQEIEARHRRQADETAEVRRRRRVRDQRAMEQQRREEEERTRNAMESEEFFQRKKRELELLLMGMNRTHGELVELVEARNREYEEQEEAIANQTARQAEESRVEMNKMLAEAAEEMNREYEQQRRSEVRKIQVAREVEERRRNQILDRRNVAAKQAGQRRRAEDDRRWAEAAKEVEETKKAADEERRIEAARQVEEAKRAEDERRSTEAANEERRIATANNLRAAVEAEEAVVRLALEVEVLKRRSQEARRQNIRNVRQAMWPYLPEYEEAKKKIQFDPITFKFAVAGFAGTGKSSLINVFLNLKPTHKDGARTGTNETTREITRYRDPGDKPPRTWIDWYDVPGGGTSNIPQSMYFNHQGLYLMDVILVLVGERFTEIDLEILKQCRAFDIPSMIVRSRTDIHIDNMAKLRAEELDVERDDALRNECRAEYIAETRDNIATQLQDHGLPPQYVYLICCSPYKPFQLAYSSFAGGAPYAGAPHFIDEMKLINDLTIAANERRGGGTAEQEGGVQRDVAPGGPSGGGNPVGMETDSTDKRQSGKELLGEGIKDQTTPSGWTKQYAWGRQPETAGSSSSPRRYINPGQRLLTQSAGRNEIVPSDSSRERIPRIQPATTPLQAAIGTITLALARTSPVSCSAELFRDIDLAINGAQLLILSPTRGVAIHIHGVIQTLVRPLNLRSVVCAGGGKEPKRWQHIVSGTPARVANLIERGSLHMADIRILVLKMQQDIPQDIHQQIYDVYRHLPQGVKILRGIMDLGSNASGE